MTAALETRLLLGALVLLAACGGSAPRAASPAEPAVAPTMTIERFLRAANQNDLDTMSRLFGTVDGPIADSWPQDEIDARMFLLASVLRHTDYSIADERIVPGRRDEATEFVVRLAMEEDEFAVPVILVRSSGNRHWLIEQIDIEKITRRAGG